MTTAHFRPLPAQAWDGAIHVLDPNRPTRPGFTGSLPLASVADYRQVQAELGLARVMISQASAYGFDNSLLLEALDALDGQGRGTVVVPADTDISELRELHKRGVRGIRFMMFGGVLQWDDMLPLAGPAADLGWHFKVQMAAAELPQRAALLASLPNQVLLDVYPVTFPSDLTEESEEIRLLADLLSRENVWASISAPNAFDSDDKIDVGVTTVLAHAPDRCIWSSNWPHLNVLPRPKNSHGLQWLDRVVPELGQRNAMLTANPTRLFDMVPGAAPSREA